MKRLASIDFAADMGCGWEVRLHYSVGTCAEFFQQAEREDPSAKRNLLDVENTRTGIINVPAFTSLDNLWCVQRFYDDWVHIPPPLLAPPSFCPHSLTPL